MARSLLPSVRRGLRLLRHRLVLVASFGRRDWRVFGEALATLLVVKVAIHTVNLSRVMAWAGRVRGNVVDLPAAEVDRLTWMVTGVSHTVFLHCLPRSLALSRVLARRGVATTLRIGVRTVDGELRAHAWVEWHGRPLNDDERSLREFAVFEDLSGNASSA
jgi:Transglutaminase-like superfamily